MLEHVLIQSVVLEQAVNTQQYVDVMSFDYLDFYTNENSLKCKELLETESLSY